MRDGSPWWHDDVKAVKKAHKKQVKDWDWDVKSHHDWDVKSGHDWDVKSWDVKSFDWDAKSGHDWDVRSFDWDTKVKSKKTKHHSKKH